MASSNSKHTRFIAQTLLVLCCMLLLTDTIAQTDPASSNHITLNRQIVQLYDAASQAGRDSSHHTSVKPYLKSELPEQPALLEEHNTHLNISKNYLEILPLFELGGGYDLGASSPIMQLEGGVQLDAAFTQKLGASVSFLGGRSTFASYLDSIIDSLHVVPAFGRAYGHGENFSYQQYSGYVSYSPNKTFNFSAGQGKHFWGDGYRSLFLSDHSSNYPYLRISTNIWRFKYVNLFTRFSDMSQGISKSERQPKYATFHYLDYNAAKWLTLSLFEAIVWQGSDSTRARGFDVNYLNPVIFYRPVEYSLGSSDNAFLGGAFKIKITKHYQLYGQLLLDEFLLSEIRARRGWWGNKNGIQLGAKAFDLFGVEGLYAQAEYNQVRPYTYSHGTVRQSYTHMSLPLAHPLGANFKEAIGFLGYRHGRIFLEGKLQYAKYGADTSAASYGQNLLLSYSTRTNDYGNFIGQGLATKLAIAELRIGWVLSFAQNMQVELRVAEHVRSSARSKEQIPFVQLGFRTALWNFYDDF